MESAALPAIQTVDSYFPDNPKPAPLPHPNPTRSYWLYSSPDCNPLAETGRHDALPSEVDIAITGSGISGVCTLYHLVQKLRNTSRNVTRIAIFEARQFCGSATGRNGGHCTAYETLNFAGEKAKYGLQDTLAHIQLEHRSVAFLMDLIKANGWEDDVELQSGGNIHLIETQEQHDIIAGQLRKAEQAGIDISEFQWLTPQECSNLTHSGEHLSGLKLPGNNLYPLKLVTRIFQLAQKQAAEAGIDVSLHTYTPVHSVTGSASDLSRWIVETDRGTITTRQVVHATNAHASYLLPQFATGSQKIVPCRNQVIAVRPDQKENFWTTGFSYNDGFDYLFQRASRTSNGSAKIPYVILGGGRNMAPRPYEIDVSDDSVLQPQVEAYLHGFLPHHFPKVFNPAKKLDIEFAWTGIIGLTQNRNPFVGPVYKDGQAQKGQYILAGYSGHGMSRAAACAEVIAGMLLADLQERPYEMPVWLPSHFLTRL